MGTAIRLLMLGLLLAALFAVIDSIRAQEATPSPAGRQIDFEDQKRRILSYSPDGTLLAVVAHDADDGHLLCVVEVATLQYQACANLSKHQIRLREEDVAWSPDSSKLAFAELGLENFIDGDLWVMDAQTGELTNVADDGFEGKFEFSGHPPGTSYSYDVLPTWRPDGSAITYSQSPYRNGEFRGSQIAETHLDGGPPETLLSVSLDLPGLIYFGMCWSGNGNFLLFTVLHPDPEYSQNGLWTADRDGKNPRMIIGSDPEFGPPVVIGVTPSGDKALVFYLESARQNGLRGPFYALVDTASGDVSPLDVELPNQPGESFVHLATLSPDGTTLLTVTRLTEPEGIVLVTDLETGETEQVGEPIPQAGMGVVGGGPVWATNGTVFIPQGIFGGTIINVENRK